MQQNNDFEIMKEACDNMDAIYDLIARVKALEDRVDSLMTMLYNAEVQDQESTQLLNVVTREAKLKNGMTFKVFETHDLKGYDEPVQLDLKVKQLVKNWQLEYDPAKMDIVQKPNGYYVLTLK